MEYAVADEKRNSSQATICADVSINEDDLDVRRRCFLVSKGYVNCEKYLTLITNPNFDYENSYYKDMQIHPCLRGCHKLVTMGEQKVALWNGRFAMKVGEMYMQLPQAPDVHASIKSFMTDECKFVRCATTALTKHRHTRQRCCLTKHTRIAHTPTLLPFIVWAGSGA